MTMIAGTPLYMAPEQFTGRNINASTDVFAFGATLYEMLAGEPPFEGMRRDAEPKPLSQMNPSVPRLLERVVHQSMAFDKSRRFCDAGEMLEPIRKMLSAVRTYMGSRPPAP